MEVGSTSGGGERIMIDLVRIVRDIYLDNDKSHVREVKHHVASCVRDDPGGFI